MRPWVIRLFDPRPPWWQNILLVIIVACSAAGALFIQFIFHPTRITRVEFGIYGGDFESPQRVIAEWSVTLSRKGFVDTVVLSTPVVQDAQQWPIGAPLADPVKFLESDDPRSVSIRKQLSDWQLDWGHNTLKKYVWHQAAFNKLNEQIGGGTLSRKLTAMLVCRNMLIAICFPLLILIIGRIAAYHYYSTLYFRLHPDHCPACKYPLHQLQTTTCPECGKEFLNESSRIAALYLRGYRGLKAHNGVNSHHESSASS